jgi:hypothetical protein
VEYHDSPLFQGRSLLVARSRPCGPVLPRAPPADVGARCFWNEQAPCKKRENDPSPVFMLCQTGDTFGDTLYRKNMRSSA